MVKFRTLLGRIAAYVGHLSQVTIDCDKNWLGKKITNFGLPSGYGGGFRKGDMMLYKLANLIVKDTSGTTAYHSHDADTSVPYKDIYGKVKEITLRVIPGTSLKIYFEFQNQNAYLTDYFRVYRNGVAVGTEQTSTVSSWASWTEIISGWKDGDTLELWGYSEYVPNNPRVRFFRILAELEPAAIENTFP